MTLLTEQELVISYDYGQFYLYDKNKSFRDDSSELTDALEEATSSRRFVGVCAGVVDVLTSAQHSRQLPVVIETLAQEPPSFDGEFAAFDHVVDVDIDLPSGVLVFEAPGGGEKTEASLPAASYRLRIAGTGYNVAMEAAQSPNGDSFRLQLWPRSKTKATERAPRLQKSWPGFADVWSA